jgi:hypothetical protein
MAPRKAARSIEPKISGTSDFGNLRSRAEKMTPEKQGVQNDKKRPEERALLFPRYFSLFFSSLANEFLLDSASTFAV